MRPAPRPARRRVLATAAAVAFSALVATGCGGSGGNDEREGPLAWLPADTWLVATGNLDAKAIDTAVESLGRLPIWSLAEGFLPASDGAGLRRELLEEVAKRSAPQGSDVPAVTAKQLEAAFGDHFGFAITAADVEAINGDDAPFVAWVEVDEEDAALAAAKGLFDGPEREGEHEGVTYYEAADDAATFLIEDGLLVVSTTPKRIEALIDVREGDESLASDETAVAVLEAGVGAAIAGFAIQTEPLLDAAPELVRGQADQLKEDGEASQETKDAAAKAARIADQLDAALESNAVDELVPDWISGSATIDGTGLRIRGSWSQPHALADPDPGSRELAERMPVDASVVSAVVSDGSQLARIQEAWADVRAAADLDLRQLVATECPPARRWACDLGVELALTVLEDEDLAKAEAESGDTASVSTQHFSPEPRTSRLLEVTSTAGVVDYTPPAEPADAARAAGLIVTRSADGLSVTVRLRPGSPIRRTLATKLDPARAAWLAALGFDLRALLSPAGLTITTETVDDLLVAGFPQDAPSTVVPALEGDADTLADAETYRDVVAAARPPKRVGAYAFVNLTAYVDAILARVAAGNPDMQRMVPTIRNNLSDVPGIVTWSSRERVNGTDVGVYELALPILE